MERWDEARDGQAAPGQAIYDGARLTGDAVLEADVVIIGSGAGGGVSAEILSQQGLRVLLIEEGPYRPTAAFKMREAFAYPELYQESGARKTKDKAISVYQGRCVGGSTTVNWTTSFRTPPATLRHWQEQHGLPELSESELAPWFARMEERLAIARWEVPANANNAVLARGASRLGFQHGVLARNVKGCGNLGLCGLGCPLGAKQSMLVTTIPAALQGATSLWTRLRAEAFTYTRDTITGLICQPLAADGLRPSPYRLTVKARAYVLSAGAIGSPALLLRSGGLNPYGQVGRRTFLHPVNISAAVMPEEVRPYEGAPQSVYSDEFLWPTSGESVGFKLETPPVQPMLAATILRGYGGSHARLMRQLPHMAVLIALLRDGFHPESQGGQVELGRYGHPVLDYPLTDYLWRGFARSYLAMAEIQFAAGARYVIPVHEEASPYRNLAAVKKALAGHLSLSARRGRLLAKICSAHVMGGCAMGGDERRSVVNVQGRLHHKDNLYIFDGSVFPTSLGANPQLSIYGLTARNATRLAAELG